MADPVLAIGYFREAQKEFGKGDMVKALMYRHIAEAWLKQALEISRYYGYYPELYPELFIPNDPNNPQNLAKALIKNDGERTVALVPYERSLLWNSALVMSASSEALDSKFDSKLPRAA